MTIFEKDEIYINRKSKGAYWCVKSDPVVLREMSGRRLIRDPKPEKWRKLERIPLG